MAWLFSGPIFLVFFVLRDIWYMFYILSKHQGCRKALKIEEVSFGVVRDEADEVQRFNEARIVAIQKYMAVKLEI